VDEPAQGTPQHAGQQPDDPEAGQQEFGLRWGIKSSFVDYVARMPDGRLSVGGGAEPGQAGGVVFPPIRGARRTTEDNVDERIWEFGGEARFAGHFGMLFVRIASPTIAVRDGVGRLTIADPYVADGGERLTLADVVVHEQSQSPGALVWKSSAVLMHASARALFNDVYQAGEPFDPLTLVLPDH
jgi:hypothetical protein